MYAFVGKSVGVGGSNKPQDVAFIQFALKTIAGTKGIKQFYTGSINGKYSNDLSNSISEFMEPNKRMPGFNGDLDKPIFYHAKGILKLIPAKYQKYNFHILLNGQSIFLSNKTAGTSKSPYDHKVLHMMNKEAKELVAFITHLANYYNVVATIKATDVSANGTIYIKFMFSGGKLVDSTSANIKEASGGSIKTFIKVVSKLISRDQLLLWDFVSKDEFLLRTMNKIPYAEIEGLKSFKAQLLGWKGSLKFPDDSVLSRCLEIYSIVRISDKKDDGKIKELSQCFGTSWATTVRQEEVHKANCVTYFETLKELKRQQVELMKELADLKQKHPVLFYAENQNELKPTDEILIDAGKEGVGAVGGKAAGTVVKKSSKIIGEAVEFSIESLVDIFVDDVDALDWTIMAIGAVGIIILAVGGGGIIATGAAIAGGAKALFDVSESLYADISTNMSKEEENEIISKILTIKNTLMNVNDGVQKIVAVMNADNCFVAIEDYGFSEAEIEQANAEIKQLGIA